MKLSFNSRTPSRINSLFTLLLILLLAVLLGWLSSRYPMQFDWTRSGRHSLSEASMQVLAKMQDPVDITAYVRKEAGLREAVQQFIQRYQRNKPDITLHFINPDVVPDEIRELGITQANEMVIRYQGRSQHVQPGSEEEMTNALQRLLRESEHWLAFVEGHGERSGLGDANFDLGEWGKQLKNRGFRIQPVNLADVRAIPDNTRVLIIAGPRVEYLPGEIDLLKEYLANGGNLLWLTDPDQEKLMAPLAELLQVQVKPGTIIDFAGRLIGLDDPTIVLETESLYPPHPATVDFSYTTFFPGATVIDSSNATDWQVKPLISSGDHTWLETGPLQGEVGFDEGSDEQGPLELGISLERDIEHASAEKAGNKTQRVVIIGDGDFLSNTYVANSGNMELGLRIINWLSHDDDFIRIPANIAADTQLDLSPLAGGIIGFGFLFILPLVLFFTGIGIWWRRRKQ
ncbi:MAG TPA: GldG family protein [Gammaproteobacteria bacterium]|nr:GldG family protein [Gammaproteobacteria bacterium]